MWEREREKELPSAKKKVNFTLEIILPCRGSRYLFIILLKNIYLFKTNESVYN